MRDIDLYRRVLGLDKPWTVARVDLDVAGHRVDIWVGHAPGVMWNCPQCGREEKGLRLCVLRVRFRDCGPGWPGGGIVESG